MCDQSPDQSRRAAAAAVALSPGATTLPLPDRRNCKGLFLLLLLLALMAVVA